MVAGHAKEEEAALGTRGHSLCAAAGDTRAPRPPGPGEDVYRSRSGCMGDPSALKAGHRSGAQHLEPRGLTASRRGREEVANSPDLGFASSTAQRFTS